VAAQRRGRLIRFGVAAATIVLLGFAALEVELVTRAIRSGTTTAVGIDIGQYLAHTHRWLDGEGWYLPAQLSGPYVVETIEGNVYPPTLLYLTVPFAMGAPMVLWYAIPLALIALTFWRHRPAWWAWPILALVLVYPRTWTVVVLGNPAMWAIALGVAGAAWGWPALGATLKLTFAPLALVGIRRRSWWIGLAAAIAMGLPFGTLWFDYVSVLANTESSRGLAYVLGELPIGLGLVVVGLSGLAAGDSRAAVQAEPREGGFALAGRQFGALAVAAIRAGGSEARMR
jgi:hypothetical protein